MSLPIPDGAFGAYLFDCDGTIVDSMPLHYLAWKTVLTEWNCAFDEDLFYAWGGKPVSEIIATLNDMHQLAMPVGTLGAQKESLFWESLAQLKAIPEVVAHIDAQHGRIPFAVVSGSTRDSVIRSLTAVGLLDKFQTIVGAEDYRRSKPAPDAFLLAAERLGVAPKDCLVFEDTDMGIRAAEAAGMAWVRVPSTRQRQ